MSISKCAKALKCREGRIAISAVVSVVLLLFFAGIIARGQEAPPPQPPTSASASPDAPEPPTPPAEYIGSEICRGCHAQAWEEVAPTTMGKLMLIKPRTVNERRGCEACHGPGSRHIEDPSRQTIITFDRKSAAPVKEQNQACLQCHDKANHIWWKNSAHAQRALSCSRCHKVHTGADKSTLHAGSKQELCAQCHANKKAQSMRRSHHPLPEGKMNCSDCHNPHGSSGPQMLHTRSINETCYRCHADKRGPFLWQHPPVFENCANCHEPHGTVHRQMVKVKAERLCQRCHIATGHPSTPHGPRTRFVFNHSCLNCHQQIHGSNHPSGNFFLR